MATNNERLAELDAIMFDLNDVRDLTSTDKPAASKLHLTCFARFIAISGGNAQVCEMLDTVGAELNRSYARIASA